MQTVTVSEKGQVVIPVQIRRSLGITAGCQLNFSLEGQVIHAAVKRQMVPTTPQDGFGMLVCRQPGQRRLADFDVALSTSVCKSGHGSRVSVNAELKYTKLHQVPI